jgi:hypothetical protein
MRESGTLTHQHILNPNNLTCKNLDKSNPIKNPNDVMLHVPNPLNFVSFSMVGTSAHHFGIKLVHRVSNPVVYYPLTFHSKSFPEVVREAHFTISQCPMVRKKYDCESCHVHNRISREMQTSTFPPASLSHRPKRGVFETYIRDSKCESSESGFRKSTLGREVHIPQHGGNVICDVKVIDQIGTRHHAVAVSRYTVVNMARFTIVFFCTIGHCTCY